MCGTIQTQALTGKLSVPLPLCSLAQTFGFTGANLTTITAVYAGVTYIQTLTYSGANVTGISQFVPQ